jgi:hypothetical protein
MAWDYYTIVARKMKKGADKLEIISVTMNEKNCTDKGEFMKNPNFEEEDAPDELRDCVYMGGAVDNRCRKIAGTWW